MSFTANRTYILETGLNYDPAGNGNIALKFVGEVTVGNSDISWKTGGDAFTKIADIIAAGGSPVIIGSGFTGRIAVTASAPLISTGSETSSATGTFEYYVFDERIPSSLDSPILGIHVLAEPGEVSLITLSNSAITFPAGSLTASGIYEYGVKEIVSITTAGTLLGIAPALKPFMY